jgi:hypothetical protein
MHGVWPTIVAPVLDALRPALILDIGDDDARTARLCAHHARPWNGRVLSLQPLASASAGERLSIEALPAVAALGERPRPDLALLHGDTGWPTDAVLHGLATSAAKADLPLPVVLIHGAALGELRGAVESFVTSRSDVRAIYLPGLGATAVLAGLEQEQGGGGDLDRVLDELSLSGLIEAQITLLEAERLVLADRAEQAEHRASGAEQRLVDQGVALAGHDRLRARIAELSSPPAVAVVEPAELPPEEPAEVPEEPSQASVRGLLKPSKLLAELNWQGPELELAMPIPYDSRQIVDHRAEREVALAAGVDARALRARLCSILQRADGPIAISLLLGEASAEVADTALRIARAVPEVRVFDDLARVDAGARLFGENGEYAQGSAEHAAKQAVRAVAYLLPGLPPEGSGGSHSLVQEARGLRRLGCEARICVPGLSLGTASSLYGNEDELFVPYEDPAEIEDAVGPATVAIATEHPSLPLLERLVQARPEIAPAYYVQDYEPLFASPESGRSDRALLSYSAIAGQVLFAKTHWLCNVVSALHGVPIVKVMPSLDRDVFHAETRAPADHVVRIAAMVRPRTPRRRPSATLEILARIVAELGADAQAFTFGCDWSGYAKLARSDTTGVEHLGLLSRGQVAGLMRRCDIFIDASAYQAFGRSGLEGMACGAVPVLPSFGGVHEYAQHDRDSLIFEDDRPAAIAESVLALARDRDRLGRLREAGLRSAVRFSIEQAAQSQLDLFSTAVRRWGEPARAFA